MHVGPGRVIRAVGVLAFVAALSGCSSADQPRSAATGEAGGRGTIRGSVAMVGGPASGVSVAITSGTLYVRGEGLDESHALAGDGTFTVPVPVGEYRVYAKVPKHNDGAECWPVEDGETVSGDTVRVSRGRVSEIRIVCPIR